MFFYLIKIVKNLLFFTGSYSNTVFLEPLSNELEQEYIIRLENGDKDARNKLIEHNLRLVAHIVKKFESQCSDTDDLISIGTIGLIKAIDSFKINKNIKITTYAARCIENATCTSKNFLIELMHYLNKLELKYNFLTR